MNIRKTIGLFAALLGFAGTSHGGILETEAPNNGSGGVWMDLTDLTGPGESLIVDRLDIGGFSGTTDTAVDVEVWTRPGGYEGFTNEADGWTLTQTVTVMRRGETTSVPMSLPRGIRVPDGETVAVYLQALSPDGIRYTGTQHPPETSFATSNLELYSSHATTGEEAFVGNVFSPRVFSGAVHYEVLPPGILRTDPPNNGSGGVWLDLTDRTGSGEFVRVDQIDIGGFSGEAGTSVEVEVWTRPGSYEGFTDSADGWTLTQTLTVTRQGESVSVPMPLLHPIEVFDGETVGVYLQALDFHGIRYTGTSQQPPETAFATSNLELYSEHATTAVEAFVGNAFAPRSFSGVVHYEVVAQNILRTDPSNNGSGGVWLDLTDRTGGGEFVRVEQIDIGGFNGVPGTNVEVEVWTRPGSYDGFTHSADGWTLTQTLTVTRQGESVSVPMPLLHPLDVPDGETVGVYLQALNSDGIRYTGTSQQPPETVFATSNLELYSEHATTGSTAFFGAVFSPRAFSGVVRYEVMPILPPFEEWIATFDTLTDPGDRTMLADPAGDGRTNLEKFAFDGDPTSPVDDGKIAYTLEQSQGFYFLTVTLPVRDGAVFSSDRGQVSNPVDGISYAIRGSLDLALFEENVVAVSPALSFGLPELNPGWNYRSFRLETPISTLERGFLRLEVDAEP